MDVLLTFQLACGGGGGVRVVFQTATDVETGYIDFYIHSTHMRSWTYTDMGTQLFTSVYLPYNVID